MRVRKFYPRQVAKRLNRKNASSLSPGEIAALRFFTIKSRKTGVRVQINQTDVANLKGASIEEATTILTNSNQTIIMRLS